MSPEWRFKANRTAAAIKNTNPESVNAPAIAANSKLPPIYAAFSFSRAPMTVPPLPPASRDFHVSFPQLLGDLAICELVRRSSIRESLRVGLSVGTIATEMDDNLTSVLIQFPELIRQAAYEFEPSFHFVSPFCHPVHSRQGCLNGHVPQLVGLGFG